MAPPKKQLDMGSIAQSFKQLNDRLGRMVSTNAQTLSTVERGPVVEACAGFSSTARLRYPQTDANDDNNSRRNKMAIHPHQVNQLLN